PARRGHGSIRRYSDARHASPRPRASHPTQWFTVGDIIVSQPSELNLASEETSRHPAYLLYFYCITGLAGMAIIKAILPLMQQGTNYQWLILAALTIATSAFSIKIPTANSKISIGDTLAFTNLVLFGTSVGIITAALDALVGSLCARTKSSRLRYT